MTTIILGAGLLTVVVLATILVVALDLTTRRRPGWLKRVMEWQGLLGAVAGLVAASGALVLQSGMDTAASAQRTSEVAQRLGTALALQSEDLAMTLAVYERHIEAIDLPTATATNCWRIVDMIRADFVDALDIFDVALNRLTEMGDEDLVVFVGFRNKVIQAARTVAGLDPIECHETQAKTTLDLVYSVVEVSLRQYQMIALRYPVRDLEQLRVLVKDATSGGTP